MTDGATVVDQVTDSELNTLWRVAQAIAASRRFKDVETGEEAFARILVGRDLGMTATDAVSHISFIDESVFIAAEVQASLLRKFIGPDGERYDFDVVTPADVRETECHIAIKRREGGQTAWKKRGVEIFTMADAERAELTESAFYRKYPRRMLFARAVSAAIAIYAPETIHPQVGRPNLSAPITAEPERAPTVDLPEPKPLVTEQVEDPRRISQADVQHIRRIHDQLEERGDLQRFIDTLTNVGAPAHDELIQRVMGMDENQARELIARLGPRPSQIRKRHRREAATA